MHTPRPRGLFRPSSCHGQRREYYIAVYGIFPLFFRLHFGERRQSKAHHPRSLTPIPSRARWGRPGLPVAHETFPSLATGARMASARSPEVRCLRQMSASAGRVCDGHQRRRPWILALVDRGPSVDRDGPPAVPAVYRGTEGRPGPVLFSLNVDGERFVIRRAGDGGTAYDWLSGPNKGYGFGSSGTPNRPAEEHRVHIRTFLAMIDPNTGYIGDD